MGGKSLLVVGKGCKSFLHFICIYASDKLMRRLHIEPHIQRRISLDVTPSTIS